MMLRLQRERMDGGFIPSEREYYHRFGLDPEKLAHAKPDAIVMHPGPMNRGVEIDGEIADDINRSVIQDQVEMGVAVRMAAMELLAQRLRRGVRHDHAGRYPRAGGACGARLRRARGAGRAALGRDGGGGARGRRRSARRGDRAVRSGRSRDDDALGVPGRGARHRAGGAAGHARAARRAGRPRADRAVAGLWRAGHDAARSGAACASWGGSRKTWPRCASTRCPRAARGARSRPRPGPSVRAAPRGSPRWGFSRGSRSSRGSWCGWRRRDDATAPPSR